MLDVHQLCHWAAIQYPLHRLVLFFIVKFYFIFIFKAKYIYVN